MMTEEEDFEEILKVIKDRYDSIINGLELTISLDDEFKTIQENFSKRSERLRCFQRRISEWYYHGSLSGI